MFKNLQQLVVGLGEAPDLTTYDKRVSVRKTLQLIAVEAKKLRVAVLRPSQPEAK